MTFYRYMLMQCELFETINRGDWGWLGQVLVGAVPLSAKRIATWRNKLCFGGQGTTAFSDSRRIIDTHFASEISPKITF